MRQMAVAGSNGRFVSVSKLLWMVLRDQGVASRRGRRRFEEMRYRWCLRFQFCTRYFRWNGNSHGFREHEKHRTRQRVVLVVATGHLASHQGCFAPMVALHRRIFLCCGLAFGHAFRSRMSVRGANRSSAARHPTGLPCGCPHRSPEQDRGRQAHPGAYESSRSDRNADQLFHVTNCILPQIYSPRHSYSGILA
jgi:hypothetical protein